MAAVMAFFIDHLFKDPSYYFTYLVVVIGSIVLHELGHALAATWEGDPTPRYAGHLTWNPVKHMGWISLILVAVMGLGWGLTPVTPRNFRHRRWGAALVSFAGPAVNILLACVGAFVMVLLARSGVPSEAPASLFWFIVLRLNVVLFILNLIPLPPLDGFDVAEGTFDLGAMGAFLRRAGLFPLIVAIVLLNSGLLDPVINGAQLGLVRAAGAVIPA